MFSGGFRGFGGGFGGDDGPEEAASSKDVDTTKYYELLGVEKTATI